MRSRELSAVVAAGTCLLVATPLSEGSVPQQVTGVRATSGTKILVSRSRSGYLFVQLLGLRGPEPRSCFAARARLVLHDLIAGRRLTIRTEGKRVLGEVHAYVSRRRLDVGAVLLQRGLARTDTSTSFRRKAAYLRIEARARQLQRGMWGPCPSADLMIELSDSPDPAAVGGELTYRFAVTNVGQVTAQSVVMSADLPKALDPLRRRMTISAPGRCSLTNATWTAECEFDRLAPYESVVVTITVSPRVAGAFQCTAAVRSASPDRNSANNSVVEQTTVAG